MNEPLIHRADLIQSLLRKQPKGGANLLLDFARQYAGDQGMDDEAVLLKLDLQEANNEAERQEIIQQMIGLTERIVHNYDEAAILALEAQEKALANRIKNNPIKNEIVLKADGIKKTYKSTGFKLEIDSFTLRLGEITGILGENATGKTTLFRILAGELAKDGGQLQYPLFQPSGKQLNWYTIKHQIAYVPQILPEWHGSLLQNIQLEAAMHGIRGAANEKAVNYIIQRLGLSTHIHKSWQQLSGGYKLRFSLARALVWEPQLLIIDEPLAFLDIKAQLTVLNDFQHLAKSLRSPIAILLSSQHVHEIEFIANQMMFMREGKLEKVVNRSAIGKERTQNVFEFDCSLTLSTLLKKLSDINGIEIRHTGQAFLMYTPLENTPADVLNYLISHQIQPSYFRDISQSLKTYFYETLA